MGRPPKSLDSHVLLTRPIYDWINRVKQKHQEFNLLSLSEAQRDSVRSWLAARFVNSLLATDGTARDADEAEQIPSSNQNRSRGIEQRAFAAYAEIENVIESAGSMAPLTSDLVYRLKAHFEQSPIEQSPTGGAVSESATAGAASRPAAASLDLACRWFAAESFLELHPVEQSAIALLRLIEIGAVTQRNHTTAKIAASLFTMRSGLPPLIIESDHAARFAAAVAEGLRMSTRPMVELLAEAVERTLTEMIQVASRS